MADNVQEQIVDLQNRIAFQEDALQLLNEQVTSQAGELHNAHVQIVALNKKLNEVMDAVEQTTMKNVEERPPHY